MYSTEREKEVQQCHLVLSLGASMCLSHDHVLGHDPQCMVVSSVDDATITQRRQETADMVGEDVPVLVLFNSFKDSAEEDYHDDVPDQNALYNIHKNIIVALAYV